MNLVRPVPAAILLAGTLALTGCSSGSADTAGSVPTASATERATVQQYADLIEANAGLIVTYVAWSRSFEELQRGFEPMIDIRVQGKDVVAQCKSLSGKLAKALDASSDEFLGVPADDVAPMVELTRSGLETCADIRDPASPTEVYSGTRALLEAWQLWEPYGVHQEEDVNY